MLELRLSSLLARLCSVDSARACECAVCATMCPWRPGCARNPCFYCFCFAHSGHKHTPRPVPGCGPIMPNPTSAASVAAVMPAAMVSVAAYMGSVGKQVGCGCFGASTPPPHLHLLAPLH